MNDSEFWQTLAAHTAFYGNGMGLAQPANRDISLDGEIVEFYRDDRSCFSWLSSAAIRRVNPEYLARELIRRSDYSLSQKVV